MSQNFEIQPTARPGSGGVPAGKGDVSLLFAGESDERYAREMARELSHRMKNMFSIISGIVNITGRMRGAEEVAREINERVQALGRAYETTLDEASTGAIELGPAIRAVLRPYGIDGRQMQFLGNGLKVPYHVISGIGLTLHELAANAIQHGAWAREGGTVTIDWHEVEHESARCVEVTWVEQERPPNANPGSAHGAGNAMIDRLLRYSGGTIDRAWSEEGLKVTVRFPLEETAS